jgi:hypothetical protein
MFTEQGPFLAFSVMWVDFVCDLWPVDLSVAPWVLICAERVEVRSLSLFHWTSQMICDMHSK